MPPRELLMVSAILSFMIVACGARVATAEDGPALSWPREIQTPQGEIVVYQPQLETFTGQTLTCRAAVSVTPSGSGTPVFGAVWLEARVSTDRDERTVELLDVDVKDVKFPHATPEQITRFGRVLEDEIRGWAPIVSLDRILIALETAEMEQATADDLDTTPPIIKVVMHPAVLVTLDGEPVLGDMEGTKLMRVVNTPAFIVHDKGWKSYFMTDGNRWLTAVEIGGPWQPAGELPRRVEALDEARRMAGRADVAEKKDESDEPERAPRIVVATEPTELIVIDGGPQFTPIERTGLIYVMNTESDVFVEIETQRYYVLLSGRWYVGNGLDGPWSYVPGAELPEDFSRIVPGSAKGGILVSIPGTPQAADAVRETYVPQTATIDRKTATTAVTYDGEPRFEPVEGTTMAYAANTTSAVLRVEGSYYCCEQGVWFLSKTPEGPWVVCTIVPEVIYTLPPSCPIYNVRYAYVYGSTADVVYVGYTSGYTGSYVYGGTVVYGTGYHYDSWYGLLYCAHPVTYGFSFRYVSYSGGWAVRARYGRYGSAAVVVGPRGGVAVGYRSYGGWWGPGGYRGAGEVNIESKLTTSRGTWTPSTSAART